MPELPEVEFCRRALTRWAAGRRVIGVSVPDPRSIRARREDRPTQGVEAGAETLLRVVRSAPPGPILRHGKRLLWTFGDDALLLHLGMTGKWTRRPDAFAKVGLLLDDGTSIWFCDPRLLGGVVPTTVAEGRTQLSAGLGPDALDAPLPALSGRRAVKVALMDQAVVAGLGNLHAAEALWRAGIDPRVASGEVTGPAHARLARGVREQLTFALDLMANDDEITYVEEASAPNPFPLYQRGGAPCPRCGTLVEKFVQAGRTTWWCPGCQRA